MALLDSKFERHKSLSFFSILKGINEVEGRADVETTAFAAYAPLNRHIHVSSSNKEINVGEYVVFHAKVHFQFY